MATNTTHYNLVKPAYSDTADIADINGNMDKVDESMYSLGKGIAIVSIGNTHAAISAGQYVYVVNHGTLTEGLYKATAAIAANAAISGSNVTSVSSGGMNSLKSDMDSLSGKVAKFDNIVNVSSQAELDAHLASELAATDAYSVKNIAFNATSSFGVFTSGASYFGQITRPASTSYATGQVMMMGGDSLIKFKFASPTWSYSRVYTAESKSLAFTGNLNDTSLIGFYFGQGSNMTGAPVSDSNYYAVVCLGNCQIAFRHSADGATRFYERHYVNDRWYDWKNATLS